MNSTTIAADETLAGDEAQQMMDRAKKAQDRRRLTSPQNGQKGGRDAITKIIADGFIASLGNTFPLRKHRGQWFLYDRGIYRTFSIDDLKGRVMFYLRKNHPNCVTKNMVANVMENLIASDIAGIESRHSMPCWLPDGTTAAGWMAMRDCLVNVEALATRIAGKEVADFDIIRPHTAKIFSTFGLPYEYDPGATCPKWRAYLDGVQPNPEMREIVQMLFGLALVPDTSFEVFFILFGDGGCGKTVCLHVLENTVGRENVCCLPLSKFSEKHSTHLLTEHLLNIVGDLPTNDGRGSLHGIEGILKDTVSGGILSCEHKNQEPFEAHALARCIFATNSLPTFADRTSGIWDRLRVIPFDVRFRGTELQNPRLKEEIVEAELPGVFMWAVEGLAKLRSLKQFPRGPRGTEIEARHRVDCDHEQQFLLDRYTARNGAFIDSRTIYAAYWAFCSESGYQKKNIANFSADVRRVFPGALDERRRIAGVKTRGFLNIDNAVLADEEL